jgi:CheY-like chemotaxis protein
MSRSIDWGYLPPIAPRILVVDDAPEIRLMHAGLLDRFGGHVFMAENGLAALDMARWAVPDVVVTDIDMPIMDGLDLVRHLRAHATTRRAVVVAVTGDSPDAGRAALEAGCDAVLAKPCSQAVLIATIQSLLVRRGRISGATQVDFVPE